MVVIDVYSTVRTDASSGAMRGWVSTSAVSKFWAFPRTQDTWVWSDDWFGDLGSWVGCDG